MRKIALVAAVAGALALSACKGKEEAAPEATAEATEAAADASAPAADASAPAADASAAASEAPKM